MRLDAHLLVVDDDPAQRELLAGFLRDLGAEVGVASDGREALAAIRAGRPDVVISDVRMPGLDGRGLLAATKEANPEIEVVMVTAYATVPEAVACLKEGATDYLLKPLDLDQVEHVVRRAVERRHLRRENRDLRRRLGEVESLPGIVTAGGAMAEALSTVARAAPSAVPVLILGESGTGKELVARALHAASPRAGRSFVAVNGASLAPSLLESELFGHQRGAFTGADRARRGRFEIASGGTLFLDEVGDLPGAMQVKLLRVLQEGTVERVGSSTPVEVDVRIVAATHRDLLAEVAAGRFREDLYYRLAVVTVELPPLRRRRADVPLLIEHFLRKHAAGTGKEISREAMDRLIAYDYPGNVRELENVVQRCLILARGDVVSSADLPPAVRGVAGGKAIPSGGGEGGGASSLPARVAALERREIEGALAVEGGHQCRAAERLGLSERALRYKMKKYGLKTLAALGLALAALPTMAAAAAPVGGVEVEVASDYVSGEFGTGRLADVATVTVALEAGRRVRVRLTVPAVRARTSDAVLDTGAGLTPRERRALAASGRGAPPEVVEEGGWRSGLGDVRVSLAGDLAGGGARLFRIEGRADVKAPTAADELRLGTGAWDGRLGLGGEVRFWSATLFGGIGYNLLGQPAAAAVRRPLELRDVFDGTLGVESEPLGGGVRFAVWLEGSEEVIAGRGARSALGFGAATSGRTVWRLLGTIGLTESAEDFGVSLGVAVGPRRARARKP